ncbi:50S ribosomal protein L31e [Methanosalsum natronophilum]|uniref:Large ribosomal subunit protein eL31 n=1 Tax=Methanosalsum natronophilum TaxID=768733 RepID=A0A424YN50_9EURY|nr:50S ribosomal protein L31e [Methanosalsum natronophilum]MCS3922994.1 large subunit ribosomal protein L31e [Methanosalsum natronophilum]RQD80387.1 MAG: 50S ribosomal protein L31e [Methanosalsum natronophilum]
MADTVVAPTEQIYTIPLRVVKGTSKPNRANKAMNEIKKYLVRHMKSEENLIKIDKSVNEKIWEKGREKPPSSIRVRAARFEDGEIQVELA